MLADAEPFMKVRYEAEDIGSRPLPPIEVRKWRKEGVCERERERGCVREKVTVRENERERERKRERGRRRLCV